MAIVKIAVRQHNIVARPFPEFFNLDEAIANGEQLPAEDFEVTEKLDGSLGILYWLDGEPRLATRGSFTSNQALVGTKIFQERYGSAYFYPDFTYLFEIIYLANRIVVDYKGMEDIILLAIIETKTGREYSYNDVQKLVGSAFSIVRLYDGITDVHKLKELQ
ncbi:RNA ligase [Ktedonobacter robiniae]|uniref:RNA ligase n=1 Tax=Ktedonobacter robiniae TaxID=2778365 RepID=UPI0019151790|nr:RNA ligase [Ktedonobacter robiniae]